MENDGTKKATYRMAPSNYWPLFWNTCLICSLATVQLIMTLTIVGMEIGNALVDIYKANVFSGFWSFPFTISATIATYACVCTKKTQTKAAVALVFQSIAIAVLLVVTGFLIAFIKTDFTLCIGFQCTQNSTTFVAASNTGYFNFSSATHATLKRAFVVCELVFVLVFILFSIIYIVLFIKCHQHLPRIHPLRSSVSQSSRSLSTLHVNNNRSSVTEQKHRTLTATKLSNKPQKVCPNCQHVSPYIPNEDIIKCPKCDYQSNRVERGQEG